MRARGHVVIRRGVDQRHLASLKRVFPSSEALKKGDLVTFFKDYLADGAEKRRKLSVRALGTSAADKRSEPADGGRAGWLGASF